MADNTHIEWADHTFNPWEGCQKVSPGCDHCYAETRNARFNGTAINWGPGAPRRRTSASNWKQPLAWNRGAAAFAAIHGRRQRVFCASLADLFDNAVDPQWRADLFALIDATPNLDWLLLTKRIGNVVGMVADMGRDALPGHVWLGATIVNQEESDRDIPKLLATPAAVRFISAEPLLAPVDLTKAYGVTDALLPERWMGGDRWGVAPLVGRLAPFLDPGSDTLDGGPGNPGGEPDWGKLDWVIVGGESGPGARPMHPDWAQAIVDQCRAAGVAVFVKQLSSGGPKAIKDIAAFPEGLRVREFPNG